MNLIQKGELVFVRLLLPLVLGIVAGLFLPPSFLLYHLTLGIAIILFCLLWLSVSFYNQFKLYLGRWKSGILVQFFVFIIGIVLSLSKSEKLIENHFANYKSQALVVIVNSEPKLGGDILRFVAKVKQGLNANKFSPQNGLIYIALKLEKGKSNFRYGDELLISGVNTEVEPPLNPYEFDYKKNLSYQGITHQAFIYKSQVRILSRRKENSIIGYALTLRKSMVHKYSQYIHNKEAGSVVSTLILGYKAELSRDVLNAYSKTGTMHVLSVSGMHVGIVFFILGKMLWFMGRTSKLRILRAIIIITLIWFYALITGFSPSVCRAALMLSMYVLGKAINRSSNSYNLVAISAFFLLLYNSYFLFDVGFQLSYLAVLGLIYFYPRIYNLFYVENWLGDKIWSYIALSLAAQLATFPLAMYYFHNFPVYFLISNLFIVLPVTGIMYLGIVFLFIPWDALLKPIGMLLEYGIDFMNKGLFYIEQLPLATYSSYFGFFYYLLIYLIIAGVILALQYKNKFLVYSSLAFISVFISYHSICSVLSFSNSGVTIYSLRKNTAFAFFDRGRAYVYSDLDSSDKTLAFSVHPAVQANASNSVYFQLNHLSPNNAVFTEGNFFKYKNWKMLIWNKDINEKLYSKRIMVDALILSGNPKVKLEDLLKVVGFKMLFIDGSNPDYKIRQWTSAAGKMSINFYVLKKNPAYTIPLDY
ncbi:ComEC/Rec2 family competence protein [Pedobacter sp. P351]|uniref:ComEC/Rec2 family competence protein n=1 Tax=Pedobacter superstes TaxID=3133441 RepID=UPI003099E230